MGSNARGEDENESRKLAKTSNKKRKKVFPYGNYKNYYGYRIGQDLDEDPRLKVFRKEWFEVKDCLDIGCNNGRVTIQIAKKFPCRSILGIDIDYDLVKDANWSLNKAVRLESAVNKPANASKLRVEDLHDGNVEWTVNVSSNEELIEVSRESSSVEDRNLCGVVSFRTDNIVEGHRSPEKCYNTILCWLTPPAMQYECNKMDTGQLGG